MVTDKREEKSSSFPEEAPVSFKTIVLMLVIGFAVLMSVDHGDEQVSSKEKIAHRLFFPIVCQVVVPDEEMAPLLEQAKASATEKKEPWAATNFSGLNDPAVRELLVKRYITSSFLKKTHGPEDIREIVLLGCDNALDLLYRPQGVTNDLNTSDS